MAQNFPTTQYVGPYLVPHGWKAWNNQTQYDPLSVVSYNLAWYILKQPAPVGTLPTNTTYWAQVDNWQGQLVEIQTTLNNLNDEVIELKNNISVSSLNPNANKHFLFLGDSYGSIYTVGEMTITKTLTSYITEQTGWNITPYFNGGHGFNPADQSKSYLNDLQNIINNNPTWLSEITDVWIFGGANDTSDNITSIINTINYIKNNIPNVNIAICFYGVYLKNYTGVVRMLNYYKSYRTACNLTGVRFIPYINQSFLNNGELASDFVHPNNAGVQKLANAIIMAMYGNDNIPSSSYTIGGTNLSFLTNGREKRIYGNINITDLSSWTLSGFTATLQLTEPFPYSFTMYGTCVGNGNINGELKQLVFEVFYFQGSLTLRCPNQNMESLSSLSIDIYLCEFSY